MTKTVELTQQEAQQLIDLCDVATKAGGLQVARVAVPLVDKLVAAFAEPAVQAKTKTPKQASTQ